MAGGKYTWSNNQHPPTLERLDRMLVNKTWEDLFPRVIVYKLPREVSDHNPLILSTSQQQPWSKLSFRFELSWFKDPQFNHIVHEIWNWPCHDLTAFDKIQIKLKRFKQYFKGWSFNKQGEQRKEKQALHEELLLIEQHEENQCLDLSQLQRKIEVHTKILKILDDEEQYWYKRAHATWLHQGDHNTKFFHRTVNNRKRRNIIISLKDGESTIEGSSNLINHATDFYKNIFGLASGNIVPLSDELWDANEKVSEEDNIYLTKPFSETEIKAALFQMDKNKAAGPDKTPIEFF